MSVARQGTGLLLLLLALGAGACQTSKRGAEGPQPDSGHDAAPSDGDASPTGADASTEDASMADGDAALPEPIELIMCELPPVTGRPTAVHLEMEVGDCVEASPGFVLEQVLDTPPLLSEDFLFQLTVDGAGAAHIRHWFYDEPFSYLTNASGTWANDEHGPELAWPDPQTPEPQVATDAEGQQHFASSARGAITTVLAGHGPDGGPYAYEVAYAPEPDDYLDHRLDWEHSGAFPNLQLDGNGEPVIVFCSPQGLRVTTRDASAWHTRLLSTDDCIGPNNGHTGLMGEYYWPIRRHALGPDGQPYVAYRTHEGDLRVVHPGSCP